jgi:hypothetical protein
MILQNLSKNTHTYVLSGKSQVRDAL